MRWWPCQIIKITRTIIKTHIMSEKNKKTKRVRRTATKAKPAGATKKKKSAAPKKKAPPKKKKKAAAKPTTTATKVRKRVRRPKKKAEISPEIKRGQQKLIAMLKKMIKL